VVGDRTFWVGPSEDQQLFVVLDEEPSPTSPTEGQVDVNPGQRVSITGVVQEVPPMDEARESFELDEDNTARLAEERVYLAAEQVEVNSD
jgi:hypothetical protein